MSDTCRYKFLVIDNNDLLEINNLKRKTNQAIKHPEPAFKMDAPWDEETDVLNDFNVLYDEEECIFKMWYSVGYYAGADSYRWSERLAYAISSDGIHWERPQLDMVQINDSARNNYITPAINFWPIIIIDPSDISERKFKAIFQISGKEMDWAKFHIPLCLAYSADGIHWDIPTHVNPILRGVSDGCWGFRYDQDRRKYQLFTRRVPNMPRDISLYESYDLVNWQDKGRVIVPGDGYDPPEQLYDFYYMAPVRYEDFILGAISVKCTSLISEDYESYNRHQDYPDTPLGHLEGQLVYSRDGRDWHCPKDRTAIIPCGPEGSYDSGQIYPSNSPIVIDGETWIYYMSHRCLHTWWDMQQRWEHDRSVRDMGFGMLAKMPEDHWVSLDAGPTEGYFVTMPKTTKAFDWGPPHQIFVNADAENGSIEVELITPYGQAVPHFSRNECIPVKANGKDQEIKWKSGLHPWDFNKKYLGGLMAKFYLKNAKLYSYTFTRPDPDGQLERDKLNTRWCEHVKHRNGNWGRNSNEPATGFPPYRGPEVKD